MINSQPVHWHGLISGSFFIFLGETIGFPTGLITIAFLTRSLGPQDFGLLTLITIIVTWIEWSIISVFSRSTVKLVGELRDWQGVAAAVLKAHVLIGFAAGFLLFAFSGRIAEFMGAPVMRDYLRWFAVDIPLTCWGRAYRNIMIGTGQFQGRAVCNAIYLLTKMLLIFLFVGMGLSIQGVIFAHIGASLVELTVSQIFYIRVSLLRYAGYTFRKLFANSLPLFLNSLVVSCYNRLGILLLKALGGSAAAVGIYGAAQRISMGTGIFSVSLSPVLISKLSGAIRDNDLLFAKSMARQSMRAILLLLPFVTLLAGSSSEIVRFIFGDQFMDSGFILWILIYGALAQILNSVTFAILTSAGKAKWMLVISSSILLLSLGSHLLIIPRFGAPGAAFVTTAVSILGAFASVLAVHRIWHIFPPAMTLLRVAVFSVLAYTLAVLWPAADLFLLIKLSVLGLFIFMAFWLSRELGPKELALLRSLIWRKELGQVSSDIQ